MDGGAWSDNIAIAGSDPNGDHTLKKAAAIDPWNSVHLNNAVLDNGHRLERDDRAFAPRHGPRSSVVNPRVVTGVDGIPRYP